MFFGDAITLRHIIGGGFGVVGVEAEDQRGEMLSVAKDITKWTGRRTRSACSAALAACYDVKKSPPAILRNQI
jgi:hypothetical protein